MKNALLLFCFFCLTKQLSAQMSTGQTWIILSDIKESAKADYEKWMTDIFFAPMKTTQDPILKKQFNATRWLTSAQQNDDKTWTYCFLIDPVIENGDYDIEHFLVKTYGEAKGKAYLQEYEGFMASGQMFVLNQTKK